MKERGEQRNKNLTTRVWNYAKENAAQNFQVVKLAGFLSQIFQATNSQPKAHSEVRLSWSAWWRHSSKLRPAPLHDEPTESRRWGTLKTQG